MLRRTKTSGRLDWGRKSDSEALCDTGELRRDFGVELHAVGESAALAGCPCLSW
jgi:hypothetical protein